jgi:Rrf2 family iron-sulfur cluster assembly transcriptional regulator
MRLTTKGRYAVTAMIDIALNRRHGPVSVTEVAERQAISGAYLEQLFSKLKRAGLLESVRGPGGGYELARPVGEVSVAEIIAAVGEGVDATRCHGQRFRSTSMSFCQASPLSGCLPSSTICTALMQPTDG